VDTAGYRQHYCKGSYFSVAPAKAGLITRLVYPVPGHVSLGVHAVLGLDGRLRFGPDAEYVRRRMDYRVDEAKRAAFGQAARRLVPAIEDSDLAPDISGIRPKLQGPGEGFRDFVIAEESARRLPGLVNLVGMDSPGLTSALAIADHVAQLIGSS
jgi:L-2-hydroxyglutarate oxidase LhgO